MATKRYIGAGQALPQISTSSASGVFATDDEVWAECNNKRITVALATDVATTDVVEVLGRAINAANADDDLKGTEVRNFGGQQFGEWRDIRASWEGSVLTFTSTIDGESFAVTTGATTAGTGAMGSVVFSQVSTSPGDLQNGDNWQGGSLLATSDTGVIDEGSPHIKDGLGITTAYTSLIVGDEFTGDIGREPINTNWSGHPYPEYRALRMRGQALTSLTIGDMSSSLAARGKRRFDLATITGCDIKVYNSQAVDSTGEAVDIVGGVDTVIETWGGSLVYGPNRNSSPSESASELKQLTIHGGHVRIRDTVTLDSSFDGVTVNGGKLIFAASTGDAADVTIRDGDATLVNAATLGQLVVEGGVCRLGVGAANLVLHGGARLVVTKACTIATATLYAGSTIDDPDGLLTISGNVSLPNAGPTQVAINMPKGKTLTIS